MSRENVQITVLCCKNVVKLVSLENLNSGCFAGGRAVVPFRTAKLQKPVRQALRAQALVCLLYYDLRAAMPNGSPTI